MRVIVTNRYSLPFAGSDTPSHRGNVWTSSPRPRLSVSRLPTPRPELLWSHRCGGLCNRIPCGNLTGSIVAGRVHVGKTQRGRGSSFLYLLTSDDTGSFYPSIPFYPSVLFFSLFSLAGMQRKLLNLLFICCELLRLKISRNVSFVIYVTAIRALGQEFLRSSSLHEIYLVCMLVVSRYNNLSILFRSWI